MEDLKDCPFCGIKPTIHYNFGRIYIECNNSDCLIQPSTFLKSKKTTDLKDPLKRWNTRPSEQSN